MLSACEKEYIDGIVKYMNQRLGDHDFDEKNRRYVALVQMHSPNVLFDYKYQKKAEPGSVYEWIYRTRRGNRIKTEHVIISMHGCISGGFYT